MTAFYCSQRLQAVKEWRAGKKASKATGCKVTTPLLPVVPCTPADGLKPETIQMLSSVKKKGKAKGGM